MANDLKNSSIAPKYIRRAYDVKEGHDGAYVLFNPAIKGDFGDKIIGFFKTEAEAKAAATDPGYKRKPGPEDASFTVGDTAVAINDIDIGFSDGGRSPRITIPEGASFKVDNTYVDGDNEMIEIYYNGENLRIEAYKFRKAGPKTSSGSTGRKFREIN